MTHPLSSGRPGIVLCMIVKDEAPVIRRCLESVMPVISHWLIVDTGSMDGTQDVIQERLRDIPGTLLELPWRDFAHNRSEALALARPHADYVLMIDADDSLELPPGFEWPALGADAYTLDIVDGALRYPRLQLFSNRRQWHYRGVLHEFPDCEGETSQGHLGITMRRGHDGARRRNPETYRRDAAILEQALATETDPYLRSRYTFYLAQSYRDCGEPALAIARYRERAALGGWVEEVFYSHYQAALLMEAAGEPDEDVLAEYQAATAAQPARIEARHGASRLCRLRGHHARGYILAKGGLGQPLPPDALFAHPWIYETGLRDEFAVNAYWAGHHDECLDACLSLIEGGRLPAAALPRVVANARAAARELGRQAVPAASRVAEHPSADMPYRPCTAGLIRDTGTAKGRGVFATRAIAAGEIVEVCPVTLVRWNEIPVELQHIVFDWGYLTGGPAASAIALGWGSMYNHSNPSNLRYSARVEDQSLAYTAARDIALGEELTINYNQTGGDVQSNEDVWFNRTGIAPV